MLAALLEASIAYAIIATDLDGLVTTWSTGAHQILGWTAEEMVGRPASVLFTSEDRARGVPHAEMEAALAQGRSRGEGWHVRRDGTRFWAISEVMPLHGEGRCVYGLIKVLRDQTTQHIAEERQRTDTEFLRGVLAASGDIIKVLDLDGRVQFVNDTSLQAPEIGDAEEFRGGLWPAFWPGEGRDQAAAALDAAREGGAGRFQGRADTPAGSPRYWDVQVTPILSPAGRPERLLAVSRDITEAREAQLRLELSEERLQLALGASRMIGIWDLDLMAGTIFGDANFARLHGIDAAAAAAGAPVMQVFRNMDEADATHVCAQLAALIDGADSLHMEHRLTQQDGSVRWVVAHGRLVRDGAGTPIRLPGALVDVTERRENEQRLQLLMEELAHRSKNTLAVVQSIAGQTMRGEGAIAEARQALIARLQALAAAHDVLLQNSWTQAGLQSLVESTARLHASGPDAGTRLLIDGPEVTLAPQAALSFAMVLHELGTNAVKYGALSTPAGHVEVRWSVIDGDRLDFSWSEHDGPAVLTPSRQGFGSRLIQRSLAADLQATVDHAYPPEGVVLTLQAPLAALQEV